MYIIFKQAKTTTTKISYTLHIYIDIYNRIYIDIYNRRKFRSQTSDNMER